MKRHKAIMASWILPGSAFVLLLSLLAGLGFGGLPWAMAHGGIVIDGDASADWFPAAFVPLPPTDNGHVMRALGVGEFLWTDATADIRTDGTNPDTNYDLTGLRITADSANLYFLLNLAGVTDQNLPYVAIAVDTDRASGSGTAAFEEGAGVASHADAAWERQIVANAGKTGYYSGPASWNAAGVSAISAANDLIEISMPLADLEIDLDGGAVVRFTVLVGEHNGSGGLTAYSGNGALDVVSMDGTATEVGDGIIDYFFDVYFEPDGDPTSPLQISEVFYDPVSQTGVPLDERANEYIELHNPAQYLAYLDGKLLGDEPDSDLPTVFDANFQFPGTLLTGTDHPVEPGAYVVVAVDADDYDADPPRPGDGTPGFPDHHWANWEFFQGLTNEPDNPAPNLSRVYGPATGDSNATQISLDRLGEALILADGTITSTQPLSNTIVDGMNYGNWDSDQAPADTSVLEGDTVGNGPTVAEGLALHRDYARANPDTNTTSVDFVSGAPTPGFAYGLIDHAIYKTGPADVVAGDIFTYYLYYQIAGQTAPSAVITDVLPAGVDLITYAASAGGVSLVDDVEPEIVWSLGNVPPSTIGKITVTVQLDPMAPGGALIQQVAIGSQSTITEGITTNDSDDLTTTARTAALSIEKSVEAPAPIQLGDTVTYTVVIANSGDIDADGVKVTDTLPSGVTGTGLDATLTVTAGEQVELTYTAQVTDSVAYYGATIINTAAYDHVTGSGSAQASFTIATPVLEITKEVDTPHDPVHPGDTVTYTVIIANSGDADALGVQVTDVLPDGVTGTGLDETAVVTAGEQAEFTYTAQATDSVDYYGATIINTATFEHVTGGGSAQAGFIIAAPTLTIVKTVEPVSDVELGGTVTYTISIANASPADALGVVITDVLPLGVTFGDWLDQGSAMPAIPDDTITWGPADITSGQEYAFSFTAVVTTNTDFKGDNVVNTVEYDSDNAGAGAGQATFRIKGDYMIFLPLIKLND